MPSAWDCIKKFKSHQLGVDRIEYKNAADVTQGTIVINEGEQAPSDEIEIERGPFVDVLMSELKGRVEFLFSNSIIALEEIATGMNVIFKDGQQPKGQRRWAWQAAPSKRA